VEWRLGWKGLLKLVDLI
jgi:hypothetical protein